MKILPPIEIMKVHRFEPPIVFILEAYAQNVHMSVTTQIVTMLK